MVLILYLALAIVFTYPLILNFTTHIPGDGGDGQIFVWNAWWFGKSLTDPGASLAYTNYLNYPDGLSLLFHTHTWVHDALISALAPLFGLIASFNAVFLLFMVLAAFGMYLLAKSITKNWIAAFISGIVLAFAPCVFVRALGHFNLTAVWTIPWFFFFFLQLLRTKKFRFGIGCGAIFGLAMLNGFYYPLYILFFGVIVVILSLRHFFNRVVLVTFLAAVLIAFTISVPLLVLYVQSYLNHTQPEKPPIQDYELYSADLVRFFVPSFLHPFLGDLAYKVNTSFIDYGGGIENTVFIGYTVMVLSVLAVLVVRGRLTKKNKYKYFFDHPVFWLVILIIAFVLALGPTLTVLGQQEFSFLGSRKIPLPYNWLWYLPIIGGLRVPSRFAVMVMFASAVLVAITLTWLFNIINKTKWKKVLLPVSATCVTGLIIFEFLPAPFMTNDLFLPSYYNDESLFKGTVLDIPFGLQSGFRKIGRPEGKYQFSQTVHGRPMIGGYVSRIPNQEYDKLAGTPGLEFLLEYPFEPGKKEDFSLKQVSGVIKEKEIKTVIIHKDQYYLSHPDVISTLQKYVEEVMAGKLTLEQGSDLVYSIPDPKSHPAEENIREKVLPTIGILQLGETAENGLLPQRFAQAMADSTGADLGLIHIDTFQDGIPEGKISRLNIVKAYPWTDKIATAEVSQKNFNQLAESGKFGYSDYSTIPDKIKIAFPEYLLSAEDYFNQIQLEKVEITDLDVVDSIIDSYKNE